MGYSSSSSSFLILPSMAKQSQLQLQLTEVELGLQDGVDFDNSMLNLVFIQKLNFEETLEGSAEMMIFCCKV